MTIAASAILALCLIVFLDCTSLAVPADSSTAQILNRRRFVLSVLLAFLSLMLLVYGIGGSSQGKVWIQTISGNWSPDVAEKIEGSYVWTKMEVALLSTIALAINVSALYFIFDNARKILIIERRVAVRLTDLFRLRDRTIKNRIVNAFPEERRHEIRTIVNEAFQTGSDFWASRHLKTVLGEDGAKTVAQGLGEQFPPSNKNLTLSN